MVWLGLLSIKWAPFCGYMLTQFQLCLAMAQPECCLKGEAENKLSLPISLIFPKRNHGTIWGCQGRNAPSPKRHFLCGWAFCLNMQILWCFFLRSSQGAYNKPPGRSTLPWKTITRLRGSAPMKRSSAFSSAHRHSCCLPK